MQLSAGLSSFHKRGYLHGDVKPNNVGISVTSDAAVVVKILDLGMVKKDGMYMCKAGAMP